MPATAVLCPNAVPTQRLCRQCGVEVGPRKLVCATCLKANEKAKDDRKGYRRRNGAPPAPKRPDGSPRKERPYETRQAEYDRRRARNAGKGDAYRSALAAKAAQRAATALAAKLEAAEKRRLAVAERIRLKPWSDRSLPEAERYAMRYRLDPEFNLRQRLRTAFKRKRLGYKIGDHLRAAIIRGGKAPTVQRFVGYDLPTLKRHLERQFTKGMTWQAFCEGQIHIDHIRPITSYNVWDAVEVKAAWALPNLRPLWAEDNLAKGAKLDLLL